MIYAAESARITRKISRGLPSHESSVWGSEVHRRAISGAVNDRIPQCIVRKKSGSPQRTVHGHVHRWRPGQRQPP